MSDPPDVALTERILALRAIPVGAGLRAPVLGIIATHLKVRRHRPGDVLVRRGELVGGLHLLVRGALRLRTRETTVAVMSPPQSFGFLSVLARAESPCDADVTEDTVTLELDTDTLFELLEDHFELLSASMNYVAELLLHELTELPAAALSIPIDDDPGIPDHALDFIERILFLRKMGIFANSNLNALTVMSSSLVETRAAAGAVLWREGEPASDVAMVVAGRLRCSTASGKVFYQGANTVIGGIEVMASRPHWYTIEAETPILYFRGSEEVFLDLIEENFAMASDFMTLLAQRLLQLHGARADLGLGMVTERSPAASRGAK